MNIKSASGLPTPKTVCVRELARCGHFVQTATRAAIAASMSIFDSRKLSELSMPILCGASHSKS